MIAFGLDLKSQAQERLTIMGFDVFCLNNLSVSVYVLPTSIIFSITNSSELSGVSCAYSWTMILLYKKLEGEHFLPLEEVRHWEWLKIFHHCQKGKGECKVNLSYLITNNAFFSFVGHFLAMVVQSQYLQKTMITRVSIIKRLNMWNIWETFT